MQIALEAAAPRAQSILDQTVLRASNDSLPARRSGCQSSEPSFGGGSDTAVSLCGCERSEAGDDCGPPVVVGLAQAVSGGSEPFPCSVFELDPRQERIFREESHFDVGGRGPVVVLPGVGNESWRLPAQHSSADVLFAIDVALVEASAYEWLEVQLGGTVPSLRSFADKDPVVTTGTGEIELGSMHGGFVRGQ